MLKVFRRRDMVIRIFIGAILVFVSLSMVLYLIPGITGNTLDPTVAQVVAEVGDEEITTTELQTNVMNLTRSARIPAEMVWNYSEQVLDELVLEKATLQEAERMGLHVSEELLQERLRQIPDLFPNGQFVGQQQYEDMVYERFGGNVADFERRFRNSLLIDQLRKLLTDSLAVSPKEVHDELVQENETYVLSYVFLDPESLKKEIATPDPLVEGFFEKSRSRYQIGEKRTGKVLLIDRGAVQQSVSIPDADIRKNYQDNIETYRVPERVAVSHILIRAGADEKDKIEAARKKAEDLSKQIQRGADFAALATKNSEDPGSASKGGDLGYIVKGQTVPAFEKMAFELEPEKVSAPVQSEFGFHIIKVRAHEQAHVKPYEEARGEIQAAIMTERLQAALAAKAEQAAADWRKNLQDAPGVAAKHQATVVDVPASLRTDLIASIPGSGPVMQELFSIEKGWVGRPIEVPAGIALPLLVEIQQPKPAEYSEVKEQVRGDYLNDQARSLALLQAQGLARDLEEQEKKDLTRAAKAQKLTVKTSPAQTRAGTIEGVGAMSEILPSLKSLKPGDVAGPLAIGNGQLVYQLSSRSIPSEGVLALQKTTVEERLRTNKQTLAFTAYQESLKKKLTSSGDLVIHQDVLSRLAPQASPTSAPAP